MTVPLFQVDAFTAVLFGGNPAAVCLLAAPKEDEWMQLVAREMNLSETAFLLPEGDHYRLRWFTPAVEVRLCGHATLASAHVLFENGLVRSGQTIHFQTLSGELSARMNQGWIELNFPTANPSPTEAPAALLEALGVKPVAVMLSEQRLLIEVASEEEVRSLKPDFSTLRKMKGRGVVVTSAATMPGVDFVSRYFAPWIGIDEDPVTGSSHTILAPYWAKKLAKKEFTAYQASSRGGTLKVRLEGERVFISGQAVTVFQGQLAD